MEWLALFFLVLSCIIFLSSLLGLWRLPDVYNRLHAVGMSDTLGIFTLIIALILLTDIFHVNVKLLFVGLMILIINPVITHLIARSARWRRLPAAGIKERENCKDGFNQP